MCHICRWGLFSFEIRRLLPVKNKRNLKTVRASFVAKCGERFSSGENDCDVWRLKNAVDITRRTFMNSHLANWMIEWSDPKPTVKYSAMLDAPATCMCSMSTVWCLFYPPDNTFQMTEVATATHTYLHEIRMCYRWRWNAIGCMLFSSALYFCVFYFCLSRCLNSNRCRGMHFFSLIIPHAGVGLSFYLAYILRIIYIV